MENRNFHCLHGLAHPEVLIVDDDDDIRESLREVLSVVGYSTVSARNGREALAYLLAHPPPQVILLDLTMPVMSGDEFLAEHDRDPRLAAIPVVVFSSTDEASATARRFHASDCLSKPADVAALLEAVHQYC